jgi:hypothetical protein
MPQARNAPQPSLRSVSSVGTFNLKLQAYSELAPQQWRRVTSSEAHQKSDSSIKHATTLNPLGTQNFKDKELFSNCSVYPIDLQKLILSLKQSKHVRTNKNDRESSKLIKSWILRFMRYSSKSQERAIADTKLNLADQKSNRSRISYHS